MNGLSPKGHKLKQTIVFYLCELTRVNFYGHSKTLGYNVVTSQTNKTVRLWSVKNSYDCGHRQMFHGPSCEYPRRRGYSLEKGEMN